MLPVPYQVGGTSRLRDSCDASARFHCHGRTLQSPCHGGVRFPYRDPTFCFTSFRQRLTWRMDWKPVGAEFSIAMSR